jgi:hypothetical protein
MAQLSASMTMVFIATLLAAGAVSGVIAGLLGVGGGIVLVPALDWVLSVYGVPHELSMKIAVATSLATIIPTAIASSRAHRLHDAIDDRVIRAWIVPLMAGAFTGVAIATQLHADTLRIVFAVVATLVALKMFLPLEGKVLRDTLPLNWATAWIPFAIGAISTLMGIGGGSLSVPVMTLCSYSIQRAVGTASLLGLWIALPATLGFLLVNTHDVVTPPLTMGYVNLLAVGLLASMTWLTAPIGAEWAHRMSRRQLQSAFGVFLLLMAVRMVWRSVH